MDIRKGIDIDPTIKKMLVIGVEKSNKTGFIGTCPRPILVFAGESNCLVRLGGQPDIDFVECYDKKDPATGKLEMAGAGIRRFDKNFQELLMMKDIPYKTIAIDPINFISDAKLAELQRTNPQLKTKVGWDRAIYTLILEEHHKILSRLLAFDDAVVVCTSHVEIREDDTTGHKMFMAAMNGKIRDSIGGWFHAVFFTTIQQGPTPKFLLQALPDFQRKCGVAVPLGCENIVTKEMPCNYAEIVKQLKEAREKK